MVASQSHKLEVAGSSPAPATNYKGDSMNIDWKEVSKSKGYHSLKQAYINDVQKANNHRQRFNTNPMRDKAEFKIFFDKVIRLAKNHAHHKGVSIIEILDKWESDRNYRWWLNYYNTIHIIHKHPRQYKQIKKRSEKNR